MPEASRSTDSRARRLVRDAAILVCVTVGLALLLEGGTRLVQRIATGSWPATELARFDCDVRAALELYRRHPFLNVAPNEGVSVTAFGKQASFNSLGYRSPERPLVASPGTQRVLISGGSTAFDILADSDRDSWPWRLEGVLAAAEPGAEVWNAGFPSWTSAENLVALSLRDLDLHPGVVVLYQGINDLQPAAHRPFDPQYEAGHAEQAARSLGFGLQPLPWYERSLFLELVRDAVIGPPQPFRRLEMRDTRSRFAALPDRAVATFERNLRSFVAVARSHGAEVVLVTQPLRIRGGRPDADRAYLGQWIRGLEPDAVPVQLERLNQVQRRLAAEIGVHLVDAAREDVWRDAHFSDPMHFSAEGSRRMAELIAPALAALLSGANG